MSTPTRPPEPVPIHALLTERELAGVAVTVRGNNPGMQPELAARIAAEAVAYLAAVAANPDLALAPSPVVDEGWHAIILDTRLRDRLNARLGTVIHHTPELPEDGGYDPDVINRTIAAIEASGRIPDLPLWAGPGEQDIAVTASTWHTPATEPPIQPIYKPPPPPPPPPPKK